VEGTLKINDKLQLDKAHELNPRDPMSHENIMLYCMHEQFVVLIFEKLQYSANHMHKN